MKFSYFKSALFAILLAPIFLFSSSGVTSQRQETKQPLYTASDTVTYETNATYGGYFSDYKNYNIPVESDKGFTLNYGVYYTGTETLDTSIIKLKRNSANSMIFEVPYLLPYVDNQYLHRKGLYNEFKYFDSKEWTFYIWETEPKGLSQPYFNSTNFSVKGRKVNESTENNIEVTYNSIYSYENKNVLQNLVITLNSGELKDYEYIKVDTGKLIYLQKVYDIQEYGGWTMNEMFGDVTPNSFYIYPTIHTQITGTKINNLTKESSWYEVPFSSSEKRSFKNETTALTFIKDKISERTNEYRFNNAIYNSETYFSLSSNTYQDAFGIGKVYTNVEPYDKSTFIHGNSYQICLIPEYKEVSYDTLLRHEIEKLYAFDISDTTNIANFIDVQAEKFVKECSVFKEIHPADPYSTEESVVFSDYEFYQGASLSSMLEETIKYYPTGSDSPVSETLNANEELTLSKGNTLYSFPYQVSDGVITEYKNIFNVSSSNNLSSQVSPSGHQEFVNIVSSLFANSIESSQYINRESSTNKIKFTSNDLSFVRITKDDEAPTTLKAQRTYNLSSSGYASVKTNEPAEYDFSLPGKYKIEFINRSDSSSITKNLNIFGSDYIGVDIDNANNKELTFTIAHPEGSTLSSIAIYESSTKVDNVDKQTFIKEIDALDDATLTNLGFKKKNYDDDDHAINVSNNTLTFKESNSSVSNQFKKTYYIKFSIANVTRTFYLNWNYVPASADSLEITFDEWESNIGYTTKYNINAYSSTGEEVSSESKAITVTTSTPSVVTIDESSQTIRAIDSGEASITFSLVNGAASVTKSFTVTDKDELRKQIVVNKNEFDLKVGGKEKLEISFTPDNTFSPSGLSYEISDKNVIAFINGEIRALKEGYSYITISHSDPGLKPVEIFVFVEAKDPGTSESSSEEPTSEPVSEESSSEVISSEVTSESISESSSSEATPPEEKTEENNSGTIAVIIILGSLTLVITGTVIFLIARAKKTSGMKK